MPTPSLIHASILIAISLSLTPRTVGAEPSTDSIPAAEPVAPDVNWWDEYGNEIRALSPSAQFEWGQAMVAHYQHDIVQD